LKLNAISAYLHASINYIPFILINKIHRGFRQKRIIQTIPRYNLALILIGMLSSHLMEMIKYIFKGYNACRLLPLAIGC